MLGCGILTLIVVEVTRLYLGVSGNLGEQAAELSTFWSASLILQLPLMIIIFIIALSMHQILEVLALSVSGVMLSIQLSVSFQVLRSITRNQPLWKWCCWRHHIVINTLGRLEEDGLARVHWIIDLDRVGEEASAACIKWKVWLILLSSCSLHFKLPSWLSMHFTIKYESLKRVERKTFCNCTISSFRTRMLVYDK